MSDSSDLNLLIDAATDAGRIASRYFRAEPRRWDKPGGAGPVTEADLKIDAMLRETLLAARPSYGWLSEESEDSEARLDAREVFIIDPIDGTRAYAEGSKTFAHSLAIARDGVISEGVVFLPERGLMFAAQRGGGAVLNDQPITTSRREQLEGANVLAAKPNFDATHWQGGGLPANRHFRSSLAYRLCLVAQGRFDAMLTLRDTWEWDIAAGALIAEEAGARVTDMSGAPVRFNNKVPQRPGLLVANPVLQATLVQRLKPPFAMPSKAAT